MEKETLLLIGNGFDVAHGYRTKYVNFVNSEFFKALEGGYFHTHIINVLKDENCRWVDLEIELYNYSLKLTENYECATETFKQEFFNLSKALQDYLTSLNATEPVGNPTPEISKLIELWTKYENIVATICFNYSQFFSLECQDEYSPIQGGIKKVHGKVYPLRGNTNNSIVLGIDDSMAVNPLHNFLYKSHNENLQIEGIGDLIMSAEKYIIFGCSLGCTDEWYFRKVFSQKGKTFEVYYYGEKEKYEILNRIHILSGGTMDLSNDNLKLYDSSNLSELNKVLKSDYNKMQ